MKVLEYINAIHNKVEFTQLPYNRNPLHYYAMFGSMNPIGFYFRQIDPSGLQEIMWAQMDDLGLTPVDYFFLYVDEDFPPKNFLKTVNKKTLLF